MFASLISKAVLLRFEGGAYVLPTSLDSAIAPLRWEGPHALTNALQHLCALYDSLLPSRGEQGRPKGARFRGRPHTLPFAALPASPPVPSQPVPLAPSLGLPTSHP